MLLKHMLLVVIIAWVTYQFLALFSTEDIKKCLDGKNVVITGASKGIGEQMAYQYARYGANVFITARTEIRLEEVIDKCKSLGVKNRKYGYIAADMRHVNSSSTVIKAAIEMFGDIDQLILNHARHPPVYKWSGTEEQLQELDEILNINMVSFVYLTAAALPSLQAAHGAVGVVSSGLGRMPTPFTLEYQTSKFALDGFYSGLRYEFKATKENVSITYCTIGLIGTESGKDAVIRARRFMGSAWLLEVVPPAAPEDAAHAIITAVTQRQGELYFPGYQFMWLVSVLRSLLPEMEKIDAIGFFQK